MHGIMYASKITLTIIRQVTNASLRGYNRTGNLVYRNYIPDPVYLQNRRIPLTTATILGERSLPDDGNYTVTTQLTIVSIFPHSYHDTTYSTNYSIIFSMENDLMCSSHV